jgi:4,5-DOPA dioxygenase extradiol
MRQPDVETLLHYRQQAPDGVRAHPTEEHLLPLFVALGAAGSAAQPQPFYRGISDYVLAMDGYAFV